MSLKAVVFDMDGVVVDSTHAWFLTFNKSLEHFNLPTVSEEKFMAGILGESTQDDIEKYFVGVSEAELVSAYDMYFRVNLSGVKVFADTLPLLDFLHSEGVKTAIATNSPRELALLTLEHAKILGKFDLVLAADDVERGKPHPEMILKACAELGVGVDEILYVGDTVSDVKAAAAAGCRMIGVNVEAGQQVTRLRELIPIVKDGLAAD